MHDDMYVYVPILIYIYYTVPVQCIIISPIYIYVYMYILYLKYSNALILVFFVFTARSGAVVFLLEVNQPCLKIRIVSMPCWELFDEQDQEYQELRMASWQLSWRLNALSIGSIDFGDI